jgi:hypothetical protein
MADWPDEDSTYYIKEMRATEWRSVVSQFAQQQSSGSDVGLGSFASRAISTSRQRMSALPRKRRRLTARSACRREAEKSFG